MAHRFVRCVGPLASVLLVLSFSQPAGASVVRPARQAGGTTAVSIDSGGLTVSGAHTTWRLSVAAEASSSGATIFASLVHGTAATSAEEHGWSVGSLPASSIKKLGAGKWQVKPPAASISPLFPAFNLTFTATSHSREACSSGSSTFYKGTLKGAFKLATGFSSMGTVGGTTVAFSSPNIAVVDQGCKPKPTQVSCVSALTWTALPTGPNAVFASGATTKGIDAISLFQSTKLSSPANAGRTDTVFAAEPPATYSGGLLTATTKSGSIITGSAQVTTQFSEPPQQSTCYINHVAKTLSSTTSIGSFSSNLSANTLLTGVMAAPTSGDGEVTVTSFS